MISSTHSRYLVELKGGQSTSESDLRSRDGATDLRYLLSFPLCPSIAKAAHTQHAECLEVLQESGPEGQVWNPSDDAHHLGR